MCECWFETLYRKTTEFKGRSSRQSMPQVCAQQGKPHTTNLGNTAAEKNDPQKRFSYHLLPIGQILKIKVVPVGCPDSSRSRWIDLSAWKRAASSMVYLGRCGKKEDRLNSGITPGRYNRFSNCRLNYFGWTIKMWLTIIYINIYKCLFVFP